MSLALWPAFNASLNAASAVLLLVGWAAIRAKRVGVHMRCMGAALAVSGTFLISYLWYHARAGVVHFAGTGWIRPVYLAILLSHTVLAVVIVPLALRTAWLGRAGRISSHVRIAVWTLPLWLYVSVTGVIVYWMLYRLGS